MNILFWLIVHATSPNPPPPTCPVACQPFPLGNNSRHALHAKNAAEKTEQKNQPLWKGGLPRETEAFSRDAGHGGEAGNEGNEGPAAVSAPLSPGLILFRLGE